MIRAGGQQRRHGRSRRLLRSGLCSADRHARRSPGPSRARWVDCLVGTVSRGLEDCCSAKLLDLSDHAHVTVACDLRAVASGTGLIVPSIGLTLLSHSGLKPAHRLCPAMAAWGGWWARYRSDSARLVRIATEAPRARPAGTISAGGPCLAERARATPCRRAAALGGGANMSASRPRGRSTSSSAVVQTGGGHRRGPEPRVGASWGSGNGRNPRY